MKRNVGMADMAVRVIAGLVLLYLGFVDNPVVSEGLPKTIIGFFALVPILTGALRWCPLYSLVGMSTCPSPSKEEQAS
jgi:hypothetical protein